ncbi:MAG: PD-(D/E)XK nuclease family protein [Rickettsia endosymbiont of Pentastiridius leporinus]
MSFLEKFAEFIINEFGKEKLRQELKIILPNNFSCLELKKILTHSYGIANLPIIIPFPAIISKKDANSNYISKLEELFILSDIIREYDKLSVEPLKNAAVLSELFNELIVSDINIKLLETYNNSKYWQNIYKFLEHSFSKWQEKIAATKKQNRSNYKLALLQEEIARIKNSRKKVILAGIFKPDSFLRKFEEQLKDHITYYNIRSNKLNSNIYYSEPANIYEEAEAIAYICSQNTNKKIAIVTTNNKLKKIYCEFLAKYKLPFEDLLGNDLKLTNIFSLIISIINILCNNFDLKTLFLLLKNPLINSKEIQELELVISGKARFISSPKYLLQILEDIEKQELIQILYEHNLYNSLDILILAKKIAEKLLPSIYEEEGGVELNELLMNLIEFGSYINSINKKDFPKTFLLLLSNIRYYKNTSDANIFIGSPEELAISKFDLVILPHFNSENWSPAVKAHTYLSKEAKQILNINYDEITPALYSNYFNLLLQNKEVIILNAKKYAGKLSTPCNLFLKLQNVNTIIPTIPYVIPVKAGIQNEVAYSNFFSTTLSVTDIETLIRSPYNFYAKKILKLRKQDKIWEEPKISDFGSFIHKVLEEYSKNHDEQYTSLNPLEKQNALVMIGNNILHSAILPLYTKKTWQTKLALLSKAFILFDIERRKNCKHIYFEIKGELNLNIADQNIKIIGIADRIEISKSNHITILDYKTGTIPTKKEIELGLSPQLIIESLMILENGFGIKTECHSRAGGNPDIIVNSVEFAYKESRIEPIIIGETTSDDVVEFKSIDYISIAYVKITSTEPYIQTTEITLSKEALERHKQGLIRLLEHYITNKFFSYDLDLSKYNDYLHLTR